MYDRMSSPLSGALLFSWILWNWKLLFYLFFSSHDILNKIDYIQRYYFDLNYNIIFPLLSTAFYILLYPFISNSAFYIQLKFKLFQNKLKNDLEKNQLLTIEQSVLLRAEIANITKEFSSMLEAKDIEIEKLKIEDNRITSPNYYEEYIAFLKSEYYEYFQEIIEMITSKQLKYKISDNVWAYYDANGIIQGKNRFTEKGKFFIRQEMNENE